MSTKVTVRDVEFDRSNVSFEFNGTTYPVLSISYGDSEAVVLTMRSSAARQMLIDSGARGTAVVSYSHPEIGEDSDEITEIDFTEGSTSIGGPGKVDAAIVCVLRGKCGSIRWTRERIRFASV